MSRFSENMEKLFVILIGVVLLAVTTQSEELEERCLWGSKYLKVKTSNGYVVGYPGKTCRNGKAFAGFRGIPYAEPPVGELRFRDPVPKKTWQGVWNATFQRPSCLQGTLDDGSIPYEKNGYSEDCLYLNVYTPNLNYLKFGLAFPRAVMVFIHPGAFTTGSSSENVFAPDFLIDQDVVVVTFNYRLGALGFLSLQNEEVPGNAGLKDQNLVLKWVKENIKQFGGDPTRITIFGESAGSASVNYHFLSKSSAGLFKSGIMQSGTSLAPWAYTPPDLAFAKARRLAKKVGCKDDSLTDLLKCIQEVPAELITEYQQKAITLEELFTLRIIAFQPTTEPNVPGAFLTDHPYNLMSSGNFTKAPAIIGLTDKEGLLVYPTLKKMDPNGFLLTLLGMDLSRFAPYNFHLKPLTKPAIKAHMEISKFYFNSKMITKALTGKVLDLLTDTMFTLSIQLTASLMANSSAPIYNYLFTYDGGYNIVKAAADIMDVPGVCHGDDLGYLFYNPDLHRNCGGNIPPESEDEVMVERMTTMWANFAKTGEPTPNTGNEIHIKWKPFTSEKQNYLDIGEELVPSESLKLNNMLFWDNLIKEIVEMRNMQGSAREAIDDLEFPDEEETL